VPVVRLTEAFRQAARSQIIVNAHRINQGALLDDDEASADVDGRSSATVRLAVAMPAVGSSSRISFASCAIVMPISTHCRSP